jgi:heme exporter protein D
MGFLAAVAAAAELVPGPRTIPWPTRERVDDLVHFESYGQWQKFILAFDLPVGVPGVVKDAFDRARKVYLLSWVDFDLVVVGEAAALASLELAVRSRYMSIEVERRRAKLAENVRRQKREATLRENDDTQKITFSRLLEMMVEVDGLTDDKIPLIQNTGGSVVGRLTSEAEPALAEIRNIRAHGNPFGSGFEAGLLELIRDLIVYAYREATKEAQALGL